MQIELCQRCFVFDAHIEVCKVTERWYFHPALLQHEGAIYGKNAKALSACRHQCRVPCWVPHFTPFLFSKVPQGTTRDLASSFSSV